jgi:hypothetical protein
MKTAAIFEKLKTTMSCDVRTLAGLSTKELSAVNTKNKQSETETYEQTIR